jgi:hypothetical protein
VIDERSENESRTTKSRQSMVFFAVLLIALVGVPVGWRWAADAMAGRGAANVSFQEFLDLKAAGHIRRVDVTGDDLIAEMNKGAFIRNNTIYRRIRTVVPMRYLKDDKSFQELVSGIEPENFVYHGRGSWGCNR